MHGARLGLVVAKRDIRRANERNQVKRIVREAFRHKRDELPALDVIVLVRGANPGRRAAWGLAALVCEAFEELAIRSTGKAVASNKRNESV
jgi:ribonuclease P protein component|tara:strand:+ start:2494 stop:2766 length:273 start_codon:yes stop_codon:yes gene_type:complete